MASPLDYEAWFQAVTQRPSRAASVPYPWQATLGNDPVCRDRLLHIPTGFGKTAGAVLPWLYHRVVRDGPGGPWPTRLVYCLPMRTLVEQTHAEVQGFVGALSLPDAQRPSVHMLMGGVEAGDWEAWPERPAVIIGTQDMLLSRALNRGYGAGRARWPMAFGLLHTDALWILDEVQLMGVGLATSAQLSAFRWAERARRAPLRPTFTWWMSATLQPSWLATVDHQARLNSLAREVVSIPAGARSGGLWKVQKALERAPDAITPDAIAALAQTRHTPGTLTLVIVNTVKRAVDVFQSLHKKPKKGPELRLVHSRFRAAERASFREAFLCREAPLPPEGRIVVATQVVEAGVDLSASLLITDPAPWSSLVQRFGRCARYEGERGTIVVAGWDPQKSAPYEGAEVTAAVEAITRLQTDHGDASPRALLAFEEALSAETRALLYPYLPAHVIRRHDIDDLFDTSPDLSGVDLDVSRYVRGGDERDVRVAWRSIEVEPRLPDHIDRAHVSPVHRDELCAVPVGDLRDFLKEGGARVAYALNYLDGRWERLGRREQDARRIVPGMTLLLPSAAGGYDISLGWSPAVKGEVSPVEPPTTADDEQALSMDQSASAAEDDSLSRARAWKTIATHGRECGEALTAIATALGLPGPLTSMLDVVGRWHDAGKAHDVFQAAITRDEEPSNVVDRRDLAKAPKDCWRKPLYPDRPGFRHELASALALIELLRRAKPDHPALTGGREALFAAMGEAPSAVPPSDAVAADHPLAAELAALDEDGLNLALWLVATHHGKVRARLVSTPLDQEGGQGTIAGVGAGDKIRLLELARQGGLRAPVPEITLSLDLAQMGLSTRYGPSWGERVERLLDAFGPFTIAYLEALTRAADWRASSMDTQDEELS